MKRWIAKILTVAGPLLLLSCATTTTRMTSAWKASNLPPHAVKKALVIAVVQSDAHMRLYEDEFVNQLRNFGVTGVQGYQVLPADRKLNKEEIAAAVQQLGADTVIVTRPLEKKNERTYVPGSPAVGYDPFYGTYYSYYTGSYDYAFSPGYVINNQVVVLETNLYSAATEKLIWAGTSDTYVEGKDEAIIKSYIKTVTKKLHNDNLF